jgi:hypothetical protein
MAKYSQNRRFVNKSLTLPKKKDNFFGKKDFKKNARHRKKSPAEASAGFYHILF